jgi:TetR/AcrR family transcriptional regulator, transcriptional repressor of aconitase
MPKIVNHDAYRDEIAQRAASYFSEHGYSGVGMRGVAQYLGMSKSALYHYFPNKEALFLACTKQVIRQFPEPNGNSAQGEAAQLQELMDSMKQSFGSEMALVFDYLRGKTPDEIAEDPAMQETVAYFLGSVTRIVGKERAPETLAQIIGTLLLHYFSGGTWRAVIPGLPSE